MSNKEGFITGPNVTSTSSRPRREENNSGLDLDYDAPRQPRGNERRHAQLSAVDAVFGNSRARIDTMRNVVGKELVDLFNEVTTDAATGGNEFRCTLVEENATMQLPAFVMLVETAIGGELISFYQVVGIENTATQRTRRISDDYVEYGERRREYDFPILAEDIMKQQRWQEAVRNAAKRLAPKSGSVEDIGSSFTIPLDYLDGKSEAEVAADCTGILQRLMDGLANRLELAQVSVMGLNSQVAKEVFKSRPNPATVSDGGKWTLGLDYTRKPVMDILGNPIRSDLAVNLSWSDGRNRSRRDNYDMVDDEFNDLDGQLATVTAVAIDSFLSPNSDLRGFDDDGEFIQMILNITEITPVENIPYSLGWAALSIAGVAQTIPTRAFINAAIGRSQTKYESLERLGNLHLLNPIPEDREVSNIGSNSTNDELSRWLNYTVDDSVHIGMNVNNTSPYGAVNGIFSQIAYSEDKDQRDELIKLLYGEIDVVTGGAFSDIVEEEDYTGSPCRPVEASQLVGTWIDADGNKRDIQEWNVPAMLQVHVDDPVLAYDRAMDMHDTYFPVESTTIDFDLARRLDLINEAIGGGGVHVRGTSDMIQFDDEFIRILTAAMIESRMVPALNESVRTMGRGRTGSNYSGSGLSELARPRRDRRGRGRDEDGSRNTRYRRR